VGRTIVGEGTAAVAVGLIDAVVGVRTIGVVVGISAVFVGTLVGLGTTLISSCPQAASMLAASRIRS
jgi:hypothetical protein